MTLLHLACRWDWSKWGLLVTQLVETHHHNVSVVNEDGDTPLHTAARFNNEGAAEYLLELSDVNARNNVGLTAFDIAHQKQHRNVLRVLVECDEIFANMSVYESDKPICINADALPMSPSAGLTAYVFMHACNMYILLTDDTTSTQEDGLNSMTSASTVDALSSAVSASLSCRFT